MVNPIYQQDEELLLNPFGSKYLSSGTYTDVNSSEFVVQEDTVVSVLTGGDASISENNIDYKTSMNLSGVTLKKGALIVAPVGEAFKSITIDSGAIMAYNCVVKGDKPSSFVGLLDDDNYPNARAAYSLRKLRAAYTGAAIRIRVDTTGNPPYDIGFNENGGLDTADLLSKAAGNSAYIDTWYDQSGEGNDVTQTDASKQPKIVNSGATILKNGLPAVEFNGSSTEFDTISFFDNRNYNVISVGSINGNDDIMYCFGGIVSGIKTFGTSLNSVNTIGTRYGSSFLSQDYTLGEQVLSFNSYAFSAYEPYINSLQSTNTTPAFRGGSAAFRIGSVGNVVFYLDGTIQEFIVYESNQLPNREGIETNINDYYTIYE